MRVPWAKNKKAYINQNNLLEIKTLNTFFINEITVG